MKIHLRSCVNETSEKGFSSTLNGKRRKLFHISDETEDETMFRLPCDQLAFKSLNIEESEHDYMEDLRRKNEVLASYNCEHEEPADVSISNVHNATTLMKLKLGRLGRKPSGRDINDIIKLLAHPSFELKSFISSCSSYKECMLEEEKIINSSLHAIGFKKRVVTDASTRVTCDVYLRSTVDVLRRQIFNVSRNSCFFQPSDNVEQYCHPMMSEIGQDGVKAVSDAIKGKANGDIVWHNGLTSTESSFVGLVQVYSDKSKVSLKESAFQFYPLHITLLNFSEEYRRKCISTGSTFLAFLPVSFYEVSEGKKVQCKVDRPQKLKLLHLSMDIILEELRGLGFPGFTCKDNVGIRRRCHPCLVSYCSDLPEAKDMSSIRNGNSGQRNCHRCLAKTSEFNSYTDNVARSGADTLRTIQEARRLRLEGKKEEADRLMDTYSLVDQIPSLMNLPFMGIHPTFDVHYIYTVEPLHLFHLGISKELKKCASERLRSETNTTMSIPTKTGIYKERTFRSARMNILNGINRMLSHIQLWSPASGLRVDFSTTSQAEGGSGLYLEDGKLIGMLQARDYRSVDMVFPFMGMLIDRCCGEESTATCTTLFVQYVEIMITTMSYTGSYEWSKKKVYLLERQIRRFKKDCIELFGDHQSSGFCTEKFHLLDHIVEDINRMGGIFGDAGLYEHAHTLVKQAYRSGSGRRQTAMDETLSSFMKEMNHSSLTNLFKVEEAEEEPRKEALIQGTTNLKESISSDCPSLVKNGKMFTLAELEKCRASVRKLREAKEITNEHDVEMIEGYISSMNETVSELVEDVTEDGCRVLINQLHKKLIAKVYANDKMRITRVTSGYVPGIQTPGGKHLNKLGTKIVMKHSPIRTLQRMVSARGFHGNPTLRQDCVLLEANENSSGAMELWVGKILVMLRLPESEQESQESHASSDNEYIFVQYFDIEPYQDTIDKSLQCIRLRWARDEEETSTVQTTGGAGKWFDLLPVSAIRRVVHVVRGDYGLQGRCITQDIDEVSWYDQSFYINRFYFNNENKRYSINDLERGKNT